MFSADCIAAEIGIYRIWKSEGVDNIVETISKADYVFTKRSCGTPSKGCRNRPLNYPLPLQYKDRVCRQRALRSVTRWFDEEVELPLMKVISRFRTRLLTLCWIPILMMKLNNCYKRGMRPRSVVIWIEVRIDSSLHALGGFIESTVRITDNS